MIFEIDPSIVTPDDLRNDPILAEDADKAYALSQSGPRTAIPSSVAYLPFSQVATPDEVADAATLLHYNSAKQHNARDKLMTRRFATSENLGQIEFNFDVSNYSPYFKSLPGKKYATMLQMLQYPFSKGSIHIPVMKAGTVTTEDDQLVIDPKYYDGSGGEVDFRMMVASQRFANKICSTKPLLDIIVSRVDPPAPPQASSDEDFADWVQDSTITDWHPVGTCAMGGKEGINGGVVDERLRVYGVKGLRVVDASIMPLQISAHLQATIYAIGEKGATMILEDWEKRC